MKKRLISFVLTLMLLVGTTLTGTVSVSAYEGEYYEPQPYVPSDEAKEVGTCRYFFLLPDEWKNEWTDSAGAYWWDGTDPCGSLDGPIKWPGYKMYQYSDEKVTMYAGNDKSSGEAVVTGTVWYLDVPADVYVIVFNNALDGGLPHYDNFDQERYSSAYLTVNISAEGIWPEDGNPNYPGPNFIWDNNNMIYIIDPTKTSVTDEGQHIFTGDWYFYHGGDKWDTQLNPIYGGEYGEEPEYVEPPYEWEDDKEIESIEVIKNPYKKFIADNEYWLDGCLDGMEVEVVYTDGTSEILNYWDDADFFEYELEFSGECVDEDDWFTPALGENVITVTCGDKTTELIIEGFGIENIEIISAPDIKLVAGCIFSWYDLYSYFDGMKVKVTYSDSEERIYTFGENYYDFYYRDIQFSSECMLYNGNVNLSPGENVFTMNCADKSADFIVIGLEVESIKIIELPYNTEFIAGEKYVIYNFLFGMKIEVTCSDGSKLVFTEEEDYLFFYYSLEYYGECVEYNEYGLCFITLASGENVITVSFAGKTADFIFTGKGIENIEIINLPYITEFIAGEEYCIFDYLYGMELEVTYLDGTTEIYTCEDDEFLFCFELNYSGDCIEYDEYGFFCYFIPDVGENVITITYGGKSAEFIITGVSDDDDFILGDVDGDGELNVKDATAIQMYLAGYSEINLDVADYDGDGDVNVKDATAIQMTLAGF